MASGGGVWSGLGDDLVDLAGDVAFQAAQGLTAGLAGGHLDRTGAAQRGVGGFAAQPLGVIPGGDEQGRGAGELLVEVVDLAGQLQDPAGQQPQRPGRGAGGVAGRAGGELRAVADEDRGAQP
jgi:hypothetical protein